MSPSSIATLVGEALPKPGQGALFGYLAALTVISGIYWDSLVH